MTSTGSKQKSSHRSGIWKVMTTIAVCLLLLAGAGLLLYFIFTTEPKAEREGATRKSAALVETIVVSRGTYQPELVVLGLVEPAEDVMLSPRVRGEITKLEANFVPGGVIKANEPLLTIDPADFKQQLAIRESELLQAQAAVTIEEGRQSVAKKEFEILDEDIDPANQALVLREPQLQTVRAQVKAAEAMLKQAELDLERTEIKAPFDAQIIERYVNVGSQVSQGDELARLVGTGEYWVMATVPLRHLRWISFEDEEGVGSTARVRHTTAWPADTHRQGTVKRLVGTVDPQTRLARVLVSVPDPLARETEGPAMILSTILEVRVDGKIIENVVRLNRDYLRQNDTVWVKNDGKLEIRQADVVFRDAQYAYIRDGLEDGDEVITTTLATVTEGIALRRIEKETQPKVNESTQEDRSEEASP